MEHLMESDGSIPQQNFVANTLLLLSTAPARLAPVAKAKVRGIRLLGVGHGICMTNNLTQSWKAEQFADVAIFPRSCNQHRAKVLRANRSVLAAISPLFAAILPDGDLEAEVGITVEWPYNEMAAVLRYIYSGNLCFTMRNKASVVRILKELQVSLPDGMQPTAEEPPIQDLAEFTPDAVNGEIRKGLTRCPADYNIYENLLAPEPLQPAEEVVVTTSASSPTKKDAFASKSTKKGQVIKAAAIVRTTKKRVRISGRACADSDQDKADLALAKSFFRGEKYSAKQRMVRIKEFVERLEAYKDMARTILQRKRVLCRATDADPSTDQSESADSELLDVAKSSSASRMSKSHVCEECGRSFLLKTYLNAHIRTNHRGKAKVPKEKIFGCSCCDFSCATQGRMEMHMRTHTDERPYKCKFCDKRFRQQPTLVCHLRTHTGEKPHPCADCGMSFSTRTSFTRHYKAKHGKDNEQTKEKRIYRCDECCKDFTRLVSFRKHCAIHSGTAVVNRCPQKKCNFTYTVLRELRSHMIASHPDKTYTCKVCFKVLLTRKHLATHEATHRPNGGFHCVECSARLSSKANLIAHQKIHKRDAC